MPAVPGVETPGEWPRGRSATGDLRGSTLALLVAVSRSDTGLIARRFNAGCEQRRGDDHPESRSDEANPIPDTQASLDKTANAAGKLTRMVDRKNLRRPFAYDNLGRRTYEYWCPAGSGSASGCGSSTPTRIFTYVYDAASQLAEVSETDSRYTFSYDDAGRVRELRWNVTLNGS